MRTRGVAPVFAHVVALLVTVTPLGAQEIRPDTLARVAGRTLDALVEALPGRIASLDELVSVALDRNLAVEGARTRRQLAEAGVRVEQGTFDPTLSLAGGLARGRTLAARTGTYALGLAQTLPWGTLLGVDVVGSRAPGIAGGTGQGYDADVLLSLRQPLLEGLGQRGVDLEVARLQRRASAADLERATRELVAGVGLAYWDLGEAEAIQAVRQRSLEIADALLFRNRQLADRSLVPEVDVITAQSGVALRRAAFIESRRARADASERLVFLVWGEGAPDHLRQAPEIMKTQDLPVAAPVVPSVDSAESTALGARQDLEAARALLQGAEVAAGAARNALLPDLTVDGSVGSGGAATNLGGALRQERSWSVGLTFSQPLLNRRDRGLSLTARLTRELRRLDVALVENAVRQDVREAVRAMEAGAERLAAANEAASLAQAQLEAERRRLDLGLGDSFRLLQTEDNAVQAALASVRARYDLARAVTRYRLAMGSGAATPPEGGG